MALAKADLGVELVDEDAKFYEDIKPRRKHTRNVVETIPITVLDEALRLDYTCESGLRWRRRPLDHFENEWSFRVWHVKYRDKPAGYRFRRVYKTRPRVYFMVTINWIGEDGKAITKQVYAHQIVELLEDNTSKQLDGLAPPRRTTIYNEKLQRQLRALDKMDAKLVAAGIDPSKMHRCPTTLRPRRIMEMRRAAEEADKAERDALLTKTEQLMQELAEEDGPSKIMRA